MGVWVAVVTLLFLVLGGFFGFTEYKARRERQTVIDISVETARRAANEALHNSETIKEALAEIQKGQVHVEASLKRIRDFDSAVQTSSQSITEYFDKLLESEKPGGLNLPAEIPDEETVQRMEEVDILLLVAERTSPGSFTSGEVAASSTQEVNNRKATYFVKLGKYWNVIENYPRAIARFRKAIDLNPKSWDGHIELAKTFSYLASRPKAPESQKTRLLGQAETHANQALHLMRAEEHYACAQRLGSKENPAARDLQYELSKILWILAWIADEREDYGRAIEFYREARENDLKQKSLSITYNLACSYAKARRFEEALAELGKVILIDENWELVPLDADFDGLRADPIFGPRLERMIAEVNATTRVNALKT